MFDAVTGVLGTALLAVIGWAINLQSRVKVLESQHTNLQNQYTSLVTMIDSKFEQLDDRMAQILDVLLSRRSS